MIISSKAYEVEMLVEVKQLGRLGSDKTDEIGRINCRPFVDSGMIDQSSSIFEVHLSSSYFDTRVCWFSLMPRDFDYDLVQE